MAASAFGARLLAWTIHGREVIHWPEDADWSKITKVRGGNPILFPFIARHFVNGRLGYWKSATGDVREMPMHGFARDSAFTTIDGAPDDTIRMRLLPTEETQAWYPFDFQFDVVYKLEPTALEVRFETTNNSPHDPMPYYAGHHFYLALPHDKRADWTLDVPCKRWGRQREDGSIAFEPATSETLNIGDEAIIDRYGIEPTRDDVVLRNTSDGRTLTFDLNCGGDAPWYAVTTWTQKPQSDFFCVEPWLGLPNAIHHGHGLRYLSPGQKETAIVRLTATGW